MAPFRAHAQVLLTVVCPTIRVVEYFGAREAELLEAWLLFAWEAIANTLATQAFGFTLATVVDVAQVWLFALNMDM
jgi:hypothetical protein